MTPQNEETLRRVREGKTYEEQQAIALQIHKERRPPPTRFDNFMGWAVLFGPIVIGFGVGYWLS